MIAALDAQSLSFSVILTEHMLRIGETKVPLDIICEKIKTLIFKISVISVSVFFVSKVQALA